MEYLNKILIGQFEASLCMLNDCIQKCPVEHWEGKIANGTFRYVAYHTLFFVELYLSPSEEAFRQRDLHERGGDERGDSLSPGLTKDETISYVPICRQIMLETIAAETREFLEGPSGFSYRKISRGELHIYNIRHIQHHTGQLSAYLRRVDKSIHPTWVGSGWREP